MSTLSFSEQLYKVGKDALEFIKQTLDERSEIIFYDTSKEREFDEEDDLYQQPTEAYVGKHNDTYYYHITKIYKEDGKYYASGLDDDETDETMEFNISELSTDVIIQIADKIAEL